MTASLITLIPKITSPGSFVGFRPICLTNFISKIVMRVLSSLLGTLLPRLISLEQVVFLPARGIAEQILMAKEMVHLLDKPSQGGRAILN